MARFPRILFLVLLLLFGAFFSPVKSATTVTGTLRNPLKFEIPYQFNAVQAKIATANAGIPFSISAGSLTAPSGTFVPGEYVTFLQDGGVVKASGQAAQDGSLSLSASLNGAFIVARSSVPLPTNTDTTMNLGYLFWGGTVSATNYYGSSGPEKAFDGNTATMWNLGTWGLGYLTRSYQRPVTVTGFNIITGGSGGGSSQTVSYSIECSSDGISWTTVVPKTTQLSPPGGTKIFVPLSNPVTGQYWRLGIEYSYDFTNVLEWEILTPRHFFALKADKTTLPANGTDQSVIDGIALNSEGLPVPDGTELPLVVDGPGFLDVPVVKNISSYVDDALPAGATTAVTSDSWTWVTFPIQSGTKAHKSDYVSGIHQHFFASGTQVYIPPGGVIEQWVYIPAGTPPREIMLQFHDSTNSWEHRAYWGENLIPWGADKTAARCYIGAIPSDRDSWVRLAVRAADVGLEGKYLDGVAYTLYDGSIIWDNTKISAITGPKSILVKTVGGKFTASYYADLVPGTAQIKAALLPPSVDITLK